MFKTTIWSLLFLNVFVACGQSVSVEPSKAPFSEQPSGSFKTLKNLGTNDTSRFTLGCLKTGSSQVKPQVDSRLKPGMVYNTTIKVASNSTQYTATLENKIVATTPVTIMQNLKILALSGVPGLSPGDATQATFILSPDGSLSTTYSPSIPDYSLPKSGCEVDDASVGTSFETLAAGEFTDLSGNIYGAQKHVLHLEGDLMCSEVKKGPGVFDAIQITTNQIPAEGTATFCGGVELFSATLIKKTDGSTVLKTIVERTLSPTAQK